MAISLKFRSEPDHFCADILQTHDPLFFLHLTSFILCLFFCPTFVTLSHHHSLSVTVSLSIQLLLFCQSERVWCKRRETLNWLFNRGQTPVVSYFTPQLSAEAERPCGFKYLTIWVAPDVSRQLIFKIDFSGLYTCMVVRGDQRHGEARGGKQNEEGKERCRNERNREEGKRAEISSWGRRGLVCVCVSYSYIMVIKCFS